MNIQFIVRSKLPDMKFGDLSDGDVFEWEDQFYIKTDGKGSNAVRLDKGLSRMFNDSTVVKIHPTTLVIKEQ